MDKEEALLEFIKSLRIALNNAAAYSKDHPYFTKTAENFFQKINSLFAFLNPIEISFAPESIFIDGRTWQDNQLYQELAAFFHLRKIKSLKIRPGFELKELVLFLSLVSEPVKEILRKGGMQNILKQKKVAHFSAEDLDYSQLLKGQGEECKDIWVYLFKNSAQTGDARQIKELSQNFDKIISNFKTEDFSNDEELRGSMEGFLDYLKDKKNEDYYKCSKELLKRILRDRGPSEKEGLDKLKSFFAELKKEDLADVLLDELFKDEGFNLFSFQVFSRLAGENQDKEIATALEQKIKNKDTPQASQKAIKRIKELFSSPDPAFISIFYHNALQTLFKDSSFRALELEPGVENYYLILLNLLEQENDEQMLKAICERISKDYNMVMKQIGPENIDLLAQVLWKKKQQEPQLTQILKNLDKEVSTLVESRIFTENSFQETEDLIDRLQESSLGYDFYITKIFNEQIFNPAVIKGLFKFFPERLEDIFAKLEKRYADIDFLVDFTQALIRVDSSFAKEAVEKIYDFSNNVVKIEILKSMQAAEKIDEEFIFSVLQSQEMLLKKEALQICRRRKGLLDRALAELFAIPGAFGRSNNLLINNLHLVEELGLQEAKGYIEGLSKRPFFWNAKLRRRAKEVLKGLK